MWNDKSDAMRLVAGMSGSRRRVDVLLNYRIAFAPAYDLLHRGILMPGQYYELFFVLRSTFIFVYRKFDAVAAIELRAFTVKMQLRIIRLVTPCLIFFNPALYLAVRRTKKHFVLNQATLT
jgi:hypothetical protein